MIHRVVKVGGEKLHDLVWLCLLLLHYNIDLFSKHSTVSAYVIVQRLEPLLQKHDGLPLYLC